MGYLGLSGNHTRAAVVTSGTVFKATWAPQLRGSYSWSIATLHFWGPLVFLHFPSAFLTFCCLHSFSFSPLVSIPHINTSNNHLSSIPDLYGILSNVILRAIFSGIIRAPCRQPHHRANPLLPGHEEACILQHLYCFSDLEKLWMASLDCELPGDRSSGTL